MRLTVCLLGYVLLQVELDRPTQTTAAERPVFEASGGGQFELSGFGFDVVEPATDA